VGDRTVAVGQPNLTSLNRTAATERLLICPIFGCAG
jgi:hypothetical protein